VFEKSVDIVIS